MALPDREAKPGVTLDQARSMSFEDRLNALLGGSLSASEIPTTPDPVILPRHVRTIGGVTTVDEARLRLQPQSLEGDIFSPSNLTWVKIRG